MSLTPVEVANMDPRDVFEALGMALATIKGRAAGSSFRVMCPWQGVSSCNPPRTCPDNLSSDLTPVQIATMNIDVARLVLAIVTDEARPLSTDRAMAMGGGDGGCQLREFPHAPVYANGNKKLFSQIEV